MSNWTEEERAEALKRRLQGKGVMDEDAAAALGGGLRCAPQRALAHRANARVAACANRLRSELRAQSSSPEVRGEALSAAGRSRRVYDTG